MGLIGLFGLREGLQGLVWGYGGLIGLFGLREGL